jgi:hypothetical protein
LGAERHHHRKAPPENPVHLRLRRDAAADNLMASSQHSSKPHARSQQQQHNHVQLWKANSSEAVAVVNQKRAARSNSAVSGRREARNQQTAAPATTCSSKPIGSAAPFYNDRAQQHSRSIYLDDKPLSSVGSNKTVSPTTSVDRGAATSRSNRGGY